MSRPNASRDRLIYEQYAAGGITMREIAAAYGVTTQRISKIIARGVTEMKVPSIKFSPSASASPLQHEMLASQKMQPDIAEIMGYFSNETMTAELGNAMEHTVRAYVHLASLTDDQRMNVFGRFCVHCGTTDKPCYCTRED